MANAGKLTVSRSTTSTPASKAAAREARDLADVRTRKFVGETTTRNKPTRRST